MIKIASRGNTYYSPLRYPGGKACLSRFLTDLIEENDLEQYTYVEPYAGGAGAALTLLMLEKVENIIINDLDEAVFSFWQSITSETDKFIKKLEKVDVSINEWNKQRAIYKSKTDNPLLLGFATFYLNRTNRSGIIEGGPIGGIGQLGTWGIDARFNKEALIERIQKVGLYRNRIKVTNKDGITIMKELSKKQKIFAYLDPPYYEKGSSLYLNHYLHKDHKKLADLLNCTNLNWMLTYDNIPEIKELYQNRTTYEFTLNYHAAIAKQGEELLILSDQLKLPMSYNDN